MENVKLELLKSPLPAEAVKQHPTKTYLSSIKAIYVIERFNDVFGVGKWTQKVEETSVDKASGMVVVKVTFEVPALGIYYESYGGNDNGGASSKNFDLGDAYKGATTDAITKIGSYLGVGMNVFKGLVDTPSVKTAAPAEDNKKWLTEEQYKNLIEKGTPNHIKIYLEKFKMKKEWREALIKKERVELTKKTDK